jgi:hypothetical protein
VTAGGGSISGQIPPERRALDAKITSGNAVLDSRPTVENQCGPFRVRNNGAASITSFTIVWNVR